MHHLSVPELRCIFAESDLDSLSGLVESHSSDSRAGVISLIASARRRLEAHDAELRRTTAMYSRESALRTADSTYIAGLDEVGRGALAGPVTVAACILPVSPLILGLDDSKKLTPVARETLSARIREVAVSYSVAHVDAREVDSLGMAKALRHAMTSALHALDCEPDHVLIDGVPMGICSSETSVVKGDACVAAIAAASILAKVARDSLMRDYAKHFPQYGFEINKGYGTAEHVAAIRRDGPCPLHRMSFHGVTEAPTLF